MIAKYIRHLYDALWTWRQPITIVPPRIGSSVSDLFVWRNSMEWKTYFELVSIPSLFEDNQLDHRTNLVFFDASGRQVFKSQFNLQNNGKLTLDISSILESSMGEIGTFAVFHSKTPEIISNLGSFLTERGYVSYRYKNAPLRSFVHGNFDAVSLDADGKLQLLGGASFLRRQYNLQHELQSGVLYEFSIVNPTTSIQPCKVKIISNHNGNVINSKHIKIPSGGIQLISINCEDFEPSRFQIESRMVMARPLVFRIQNSKMDVFHG